ncbi:MAG: hypothetical protein IPK28_15130 [Devosia sp.]|nr:hypothetical protein [Devosia sp.]
MSAQIEHFIYGTPERLEHFVADLPARIEVTQVPDGLVLREVLGDEDDVDVAMVRIKASAQKHGVAMARHGQCLNDALSDNTDRGRDIKAQTFASRTGIKAGHGFAFALPDGRFGHAIHIGSDRRGYLLLEITALVTDRPVSPDDLREAPRRYRQPILVWHTPFAVLPLSGAKPLAQLPSECCSAAAWGGPTRRRSCALKTCLVSREQTHAQVGTALILAMADAGERLTGLHGYCVWTARVGRSGLLKLMEDYATHPFLKTGDCPMPWEPVDMGEIIASLAGAPDMIAVRDKVT